jgi:ATP-binding cassette subfamily B protein
MSMHASAMGRGGRAGMNSMRRNRDILEHRIKKGTLPRMLTFAKVYRTMIIVFLVAVILDSIVSSVSPLVLRAIIDTITNTHVAHKSERLVVGLALLTAVLALIDAGLSLFERRASAVIGESLIFDLRARVYAHIQEMPIAFFSRTQTGALISRLNNDVIGAQQAFTDLFSNVVGNALLLAIILGVMFYLSWQITLVALILLPMFLLPARRVGRRLGTLFQRGMELNAEMNMVMSERFNVAGAMVVKLFGRPRDELDYFESRAGQVRDIGVRQATYQRFFFVALSLTASLATAFAYGFGGVAVLHGTLAVGTVVALTAYLTRLYGPLTQLSNLNVDYMSAMVSFERLFEILDLEPMIKDSPDARDIPDGPATLRFEHVNFEYPGAEEVSLASLEAVAVLERVERTSVLHDVSFVVEPGTMTALVGPSGAGKTTMSLLVSRLYDVTSGSVTINGVDLRDTTSSSLKATVGVVTQDPHLFHDTMRANLLFARPDATEDQIHEALVAAQIALLVASLPLGLDTVVGERGYRLSGGEKQRVALARLLLKAPRLVVLDEATAHLDNESEAAVQRALDETMSDRTSLVIAHRLSTIRNADQILVIDEGRIVQRGTHEELLEVGGLYRDLYETQFASQASTHGVRAAVNVDDRSGRGAQEGRE